MTIEQRTATLLNLPEVEWQAPPTPPNIKFQLQNRHVCISVEEARSLAIFMEELQAYHRVMYIRFQELQQQKKLLQRTGQ